MSKTPLVVYVLWHPRAQDGAKLASEIYRWFHASSGDLLRSGMGMPVFFRSAPAEPTSSAPRAIRLDEADLNVIVVLAEANLVADPEWIKYVEELGSESKNSCVIPVALHPSAYRLPDVLRRLNFLRVDERDDAPVDDAARLARRAPRLLRQLMEVIGRRVALRLSHPQESIPDLAAAPLTIFLSHAKRDGVAIAEALRSTIQRGRIRAFFDDSDLPVGRAFASELESAASLGSAAMIAIISDAYAARPWCRHEVALARTPRADVHSKHCWWVQPVLVVDALQAAPTRNVPELGNATLVRWLPENAQTTVDLLMLEVVLAGYHRLRAREVPKAPGRHVISWTPDVPTILALQRAAKERGDVVKEIGYPGNALPVTDLQALRYLYPELKLRTFEEIERQFDASLHTIDGRLVGLSTAFSDDLGSLGLGNEHLEEITLRIARCIAESGARIAFGGMLKSSGLAETLLTLVRTLTADQDIPSPSGPVPGILSYQRWPSLPTREEIASDLGICEYVLIDSPVPGDERLVNDPRVTSPERARELAYILTRMREAMMAGGTRTTAGLQAPALDARVLVGGARVDFNGCMPGLLEEVLYAFEAGRPVYVIGGFGGASALLADVLLGAKLPKEFGPEYHSGQSPKFRMLQSGLAAHGEHDRIELLFDRLHKAIARVRKNLERGLDNGLDRAENKLLMRSDHVGQIVQLLRKGLTTRLKRAK